EWEGLIMDFGDGELTWPQGIQVDQLSGTLSVSGRLHQIRSSGDHIGHFRHGP
ncbi:hypothetical protein KI387_010478, partial [Taxus chinensis]